jgi:hypothetical protein
VPAQKIKAAFTEPMLLLPTRELVEGANWTFEPKLDSFCARFATGGFPTSG